MDSAETCQRACTPPDCRLWLYLRRKHQSVLQMPGLLDQLLHRWVISCAIDLSSHFPQPHQDLLEFLMGHRVVRDGCVLCKLGEHERVLEHTLHRLRPEGRLAQRGFDRPPEAYLDKQVLEPQGTAV